MKTTITTASRARLLSAEEHQRMFTRIAGELSQVPEHIQRRQVELFTKVHPDYGAGVAKALGLK